MVKNNKGFTMIELIVSIAIFGVLSLGIVNFMTTGVGLFSTVNTGLSLQYESQTAMAQLQEYIIDCNYSIDWNDDTDTLVIVNAFENSANTDDTDYTTHTFKFDNTDKTLYYSKLVETVSVDEHNVITTTFVSSTVPAVVTRNVSVFDIALESNITITDEDNNNDGFVDPSDVYYRTDNISFTLLLEKNGREYTATQELNLRNKPRTTS